jgi:hypothetical protein
LYDEVVRFFVKLIVHFIPDSRGRRPESRQGEMAVSMLDEPIRK